MNLKEAINLSPYHRLLGLELEEVGKKEVKIKLPYKKELCGDDNETNIHGGVISTLIDVAACFAMINATGKDAPNIDLKVNYLRMAAGGDTLTAIAKAIKVGRTLGVADVEVRNQDNKLIAVGRSQLSNSSPARNELTKK